MESIEDYLRLASDPMWRLENLYTIVNKDAQKVKFKPNVVQDRINKSKHKRKMILKARQFGVSTNEIIKLLDWVMHNENATAAILAHEQGAIEKLFRIVRRAYKFLPDEAKPELDRGGGSKFEYYFPKINSRIYCDLEIRGDTVGRLHVSEAAFMKDSSRLKATLQAVPLNTGHVTIETTPNGIANHFYDMWSEEDSIYEKIFFPWYIFPEYRIQDHRVNSENLSEEERKLINKAKELYLLDVDLEQIAYRRFKKSEMRKSDYDVVKVSFEQEYPEDEASCFLSSGDSVIDPLIVNKKLKDAKKPIKTINGIRIYKEKEKDHRYVIGADPAEGVGRDNSAAVIIDTTTFDPVAVFHGQLKPSEFAYKLEEMAKLYKWPTDTSPLIACERNNHGHTVIYVLENEIHYDNIFRAKDEKLGWLSNSITRPMMVDHFIEAFEDNICNIIDQATLYECLTLIDNKGKIEASSGKHDDLIIAHAIALQVAPDLRISYSDLLSQIKL